MQRPHLNILSNSNSAIESERNKRKTLEKEVAELKNKLQKTEKSLNEWERNFPNQSAEEVVNKIKLLELQLASLANLETLNDLLNSENKELKSKLEEQERQFIAQTETLTKINK